MDETPVSITQIDNLLRILAKYDVAKPDITYQILFDSYNLVYPEKIIDKVIFHQLLAKLLKDNYAELNEAYRYNVTFEGDLFHQLGGYRQKYLEANEVARTDKNLKAMQRRTFWVTVVLAVGTTVAAVYYGIQVWEYYFPSK